MTAISIIRRHSSRPGGHVPGSAPKGAGAAKEAPSTLMDERRAP